MANIRPNQLPAAASVNPASAIIVDDGGPVEKATPLQVVDAGRPKASQGDAETGTDNEKLMTPLRVSQAIDALGFSGAQLASSSGAEMVGFGDGFGTGTVAHRINILSATARPAMAGIFSSGADQREALLEFINDSAASGKTIEWGPIDVSLEVATPNIPGDTTTRGLIVPSGSHWIMHPDTRIRAIPNAAGSYEIVNIYDKQDITIEGNGARLIGDRYDHTGTTGEWGNGLSIRGSTNIRVSDLIVEDCWGDGFYIGSTAAQNHCRDVYLKNTEAVRARRNGLSLISARGFLSEDHRSIDTAGTSPQCGIDIEPNFTTEYLEDITFLRTVTKNSAQEGFYSWLGNYSGSANPVSVRVIDCVDEGSLVGFMFSSMRDLHGRFDLVRPVSRNAREAGIALRRKSLTGPYFNIIEPKVVDWDQSQITHATASPAISIFAPASDSGVEALGGIYISSPEITVSNDAPTPPNVRSIVVLDQRTTGPAPIENVKISNPVNLAERRCWLSGFDTSLTDDNNLSVLTLPDSSITLGIADIRKTYIVPQLTASRTYDILNNEPIGWEYVFDNRSQDQGTGGQQARFRFPVGVSLFPDELGSDRWIASNTKGSRLKIRKTAADEWMVIEKVGTWATP